ncbi:hypothetical protein V5093_07295 [Enterobacter cancerogenus]|uniref:hypothetical protein n=1 Tax=Enterobacter cancerogenus TaxID=69218 RepID=UPI0030760C0F
MKPFRCTAFPVYSIQHSGACAITIATVMLSNAEGLEGRRYLVIVLMDKKRPRKEGQRSLSSLALFFIDVSLEMAFSNIRVLNSLAVSQ